MTRDATNTIIALPNPQASQVRHDARQLEGARRTTRPAQASAQGRLITATTPIKRRNYTQGISLHCLLQKGVRLLKARRYGLSHRHHLVFSSTHAWLGLSFT